MQCHLRWQDDGYISNKTQQKFLNVLSKIKQHDGSIYDKSAQLYSSSTNTDDEESDSAEFEVKTKPMYLKDVHAQQVWPLLCALQNIIILFGYSLAGIVCIPPNSFYVRFLSQKN